MMSEEEIQKAYEACTTDEERDVFAKKVGDDFKAEGGGVMDAETLEMILSFCDIAVKTTLLTLAKGLDHPRSNVRSLDADMLAQISMNPPDVVRASVFSMIDKMGLTVGDPNADPEMTDAALAAILDGGA
jgi:hypothetical protein